MGFLNFLLKAVVSFLFCIALFALVFSAATAKITSHEKMIDIFSEAMTSMNISTSMNMKEIVEKICSEQTSQELFQNVSIDCEKAKNASDKEIAKILASSIINKNYYSECSGINCLKEKGIAGIATQGFNSFLKSIFVYIAIATAFLAFLFIILSKGIASGIRGIGTNVFLSGLPFFLFKYANKEIEKKVPQQIIPILSKITTIFSEYFFILVVAGASLFVLGILLGIFRKTEKKKKEKKQTEEKEEE